jgi:hypothetical protein
MQFSFSNQEHVPISIKDLKRESLERTVERSERNKHANSGSVQLWDAEKHATADTLISKLPVGLVDANLILVNAMYQERNNVNHDGTTYHTVVFFWSPEQFATPDDMFLRRFMPIAFAELQGICDLALWRVRAFRNPYYENGAIVPGHMSYSLNLEVRSPLFDLDGKPARGEGGQPLQPKNILLCRNNQLVLDTYRARK